MSVVVTRAVVSARGAQGSARVELPNPHALSPHTIGSRLMFQAVGTTDAILARTGHSLVTNAYNDGTGWYHIAAGRSTALNMGVGQLTYYGSSSGSAGGAVSFSQYLNVDTSGNVSVTGGGAVITSGGSVGVTKGLHLFYNTSTNTGWLYSYEGTVDWYNFGIQAKTYKFQVNNVDALTIDANSNIGVRTSTFGTSAVGVLGIANGTAPSTGVADTVQFYSSDDAAGHTVPSFYCEGTNVVATGQADSASSVRVKMRINGTVYTFLCI